MAPGSKICQDWDKVKGKDWRNIDKHHLSVDLDYSNQIYQEWLSDESDKFFRVASSVELIPNLEPGKLYILYCVQNGKLM